MNTLLLFIIIPIAMLVALWGSRNLNQTRAVMAIGSSFLLATSIYLTINFIQMRNAGETAQMLYTASWEWYKPLNISFSIGVDGISTAMILLSSIIAFTGTFASWRLKPMTKEFFLWYTLLCLGVYGFFISTDLFTMFMFYETALIPMYLLIGVWGSGRKEYSAMKLTLMLMGGSAFLLMGILGIYFGSGAITMNIHEIAAMNTIPVNIQYIFFPLTFIGFGVLGALFPFHTWSPDGHACAPTSVSMLHAGVLMKLGGYGCFRIAMYLLPQAANDLAWIFIILTTVSVVYGALSAVSQTDLKYINAYSSVSHCGLVLFAILMMTKTAPGIARHFVCEQFDILSDGAIAKEERAKAFAAIDQDSAFEVYASDIDSEVLEIAKTNAERAGVDDRINFFVADARKIKKLDRRGTVVCNPPYGERLMTQREVERLYREMGDAFSALSPWQIYILTSAENFQNLYGRRADKVRKLYNGMIPCTLYQYFKNTK